MKTVFNVVMVVDHGECPGPMTLEHLQSAVRRGLVELKDMPDLGYGADSIAVEAVYNSGSMTRCYTIPVDKRTK